jgi:hypothetical protein
MRKPLSLAHRVKIVGRKVDLQHTDIRATFARARREQAQQAEATAKVVTPMKRKVA